MNYIPPTFEGVCKHMLLLQLALFYYIPPTFEGICKPSDVLHDTQMYIRGL